MHLDIVKRGLVVLGAVASSFVMVAVPANAETARDNVVPAALLCTPELPVAGSVCTPV